MEEYKNIEYFSLNGVRCEAYVYNVYDGDTITLIIKLHDTNYKWKCRLIGLDTAELRTKNEKEKEFGYKVRDILREKILHKIIDVECFEFDKYGRTLVKIYNNNICLNDWLIENNYAKKYDGGHKESFSNI